MKLGYPDTINNKAYQGEKSPFKMVDKSKADLDKDGKVSDYEENRAEAAFGSEAPLNYSPLQAREMSAKRRARRKKRVEKIDAKRIKNSELKPIKGVADEDIQYTAKKGKEKKVNRLSNKSDRISAKTTKILRKNNQVPSAKKGFESKDYGGKDDKFDSKTMKPPTRKKKSPVKARNSGGYSFSLGEDRVKKDDNTGSTTNEITTKKTDGDSGVEKPTSNKVTKTTKIVRGKRNSPNAQKTVGQAIVGGVKKVIAKRKAKRAKDPNVQAKKDGRIERRELKAEGKLFKKEQKAKVTREKNKDKLATTKKKVYKESGDASIKSGKKVKEIKGKRGLTGNPTSLYKSDKKNKK
jgi:hypothetical protein